MVYLVEISYHISQKNNVLNFLKLEKESNLTKTINGQRPDLERIEETGQRWKDVEIGASRLRWRRDPFCSASSLGFCPLAKLLA